MNKYICTNKRCQHHFTSSEMTAIIKCPCCQTELLNVEKAITTDNYLWIETMFINIQTYGVKGTFDMIDKTYSNPITRVRVRQIYFNTLRVINKHK